MPKRLKLRLRQAKLWFTYAKAYGEMWTMYILSSQQLAFTATIFLATYGLALLWSARH